MADDFVRGRGVQSVEVGLRLLEALAALGRPATLTELAASAGMAPAKAHRYLASLVEAGMVDHRRSGAYDLGPLALRVGLAAMARLDLVNRAADLLPGFVEATGATAHLNVWGDRGPTIVRWERAAQGVVTALGLGSTLPVLRSATGRVFLAFLPRRMTAARVEAERARLDRPPADEDIDALIAETRRTGHAVVDEKVIPGLHAIAGPVLNWQGEAEAVVTFISTEAEIVRSPACLAALDAVRRLVHAPEG